MEFIKLNKLWCTGEDSRSKEVWLNVNQILQIEPPQMTYAKARIYTTGVGGGYGQFSMDTVESPNEIMKQIRMATGDSVLNEILQILSENKK